MWSDANKLINSSLIGNKKEEEGGQKKKKKKKNSRRRRENPELGVDCPQEGRRGYLGMAASRQGLAALLTLQTRPVPVLAQ